MKRLDIIALIIFAASLVSCSKDMIGRRIGFYVRALPDGLTKTTYSGDTQDGKERIDWSDGDLIQIYSDQATMGGTGLHYADYLVSQSSVPSADKPVSRAQVINADGNGLNWGTGTHTFLAMYPSPSTVGVQDGTSFTNGAFSGHIPASQTVTQKTGTLSWAPDMRYAYMLAKTDGIAAGASEVPLTFGPVFTAFSFTIGPGENTSVTVDSFTLQSESQVLAGDVTINKAQTECTITGTDTAISVTFSPSLVVTSDVTFTVIVLPRDLTGLSITFSGTQIGTRTLKLADKDGVYINFPGRLKYHINNLSFPLLEDVSLADKINWEISLMAGPILWGTDIFTDLVDWDNTVVFGGSGADYTQWGVNGNKEELEWENFIYLNGEPFVWGSIGYFYENVDWDNNILTSGDIGDSTQWGSNGNKENLLWDNSVPMTAEGINWQ